MTCSKHRSSLKNSSMNRIPASTLCSSSSPSTGISSSISSSTCLFSRQSLANSLSAPGLPKQSPLRQYLNSKFLIPFFALFIVENRVEREASRQGPGLDTRNERNLRVSLSIKGTERDQSIIDETRRFSSNQRVKQESSFVKTVS